MPESENVHLMQRAREKLAEFLRAVADGLQTQSLDETDASGEKLPLDDFEEYEGELDDQMKERVEFEWDRLYKSRRRIAFQSGLTSLLAGGLGYQTKTFSVLDWNVLSFLFGFAFIVGVVALAVHVFFLVSSWKGHRYRHHHKPKDQIEWFHKIREGWRHADRPDDASPADLATQSFETEMALMRALIAQENAVANDQRAMFLRRSRSWFVIALAVISFSFAFSQVLHARHGVSVPSTENTPEAVMTDSESNESSGSESSETSSSGQTSEGNGASGEPEGSTSSGSSSGESSSEGGDGDSSSSPSHLPPNAPRMTGETIEESASSVRDKRELDSGSSKGSSDDGSTGKSGSAGSED